jgi:hypothetical protein
MTAVHPSVTDHAPLLRAIAAYGLAGTLLDLPDRQLDDDEFDQVHTAVRSQRLTGLLWSAIADGALPVSDLQRERAEESHLEALTVALVLEHLLIQTIAALDQAGISVRTLKGTTAAHLDYPDPSLRTFGDVDLLVPSEEFDDAAAVLVDQGNTRLRAEPRPGFDRRFSKGCTFRTPDGLEIDLHRTLTSGPFGVRVALAELWERSERFHLAGSTIRTLAVEERLLHTAYDTVLSGLPVGLVQLRDTAQILLTHGADVDRLRHLMRASGGEPVVARAVKWAWQELAIADVVHISVWAQNYQDDPRAAADLAVYRGESTYAAQSRATVRALPTLSDKARFVLAMALPQRSYLRGRHAGRRGAIRDRLAHPKGLGGSK